MPCRSSTHIYVWITGSRCRLEKVLLNKANNIKMHRFWLEVWKCSQLFYDLHPPNCTANAPFLLPMKFAEFSLSLWKRENQLDQRKNCLLDPISYWHKNATLWMISCRLLCSLWKLVVWLLMNIAEWFI